MIKLFALQFFATLLALLVYSWWRGGKDAFAEYVPSLEGFESMSLQSPDLVKYGRQMEPLM